MPTLPICTLLPTRHLLSGAAALALLACGFDRTDRWVDRVSTSPLCEVDELRCGEGVQRCEQGLAGPVWVTIDDCADQGLVCVVDDFECKLCQPDTKKCDGQEVLRCNESGDGYEPDSTCDTDGGFACREGGCEHLCSAARSRRSNVGCEYWAVDLDNAFIDDSLNAAAQQFAVVLSNAQPDVVAEVTIEQDDSEPLGDNEPIKIVDSTIPPLSLEKFLLGPREVDGSPPGTYDQGTHTALTRAAYRIKTSVPVVAYQFNPLENVNVFSNDASLLKPVEALVTSPGIMQRAYVAVGWPQTIASTDDPNTNFSVDDISHLRSFLTLVGTREKTSLTIKSDTPIIGKDLPLGEGEQLDLTGEHQMTLEPFDVLNLESNDFNADFTGTVIESDQPLAVFSGSEAADAPFFDNLSERRCCADHLEEQLDPVRTAGRRFVASVSANRTQAVVNAGADIGVVDQVEYFRVVAVSDDGAIVNTSLDGLNSLRLDGLGDFADISSSQDFLLESDHPVVLGNVTPSQTDAGVPRGLPGGDPSFLVIPPVEQFRHSYVFLTPDKYHFDFIRIIAPQGTRIQLDGEELSQVFGCTTRDVEPLSETGLQLDTDYVVHLCQLSFPIIDDTSDAEENVLPGEQNDGVHRIEAERKVGVLVDGFDAFVSYAYAAGTELELIVPE